MVQRLLERHGHTVAVAANGLEAINALDSDNFDVVLMDMQMPVLDGHQAIQRIRERERTWGGHTPIVAVTAHAIEGDRETCLAAGADAYVAKPIVREELLSAIEGITARTQSNSA